MQDQGKTNEQLMSELEALRQRVARIEAAESARREGGDRTRYLDILLKSIETVNKLISREMEQEDGLAKPRAPLEKQVEKRAAPLGPTQEDERVEADERQFAQQASREQMDLWQAALAAAPDLLVLKNKDLVYQAVNPSFCRFLGLKQEEVVDKTDFDLFSRSEAETWRQQDAQVMSTGTSLIQDEQVAGASGKRWFQVSRTPVIDGTGQCVGLLWSGRDITAQREAEDALRLSEARYRAVVEDQTELICRFLPDGTLTFVNDVFCRYFGRQRRELIGQPFAPVIFDEDREELKKRVLSLAPEKPATDLEVRAVAPNGSVRWLRGTIRARFDGQERVLGLQCVARDVTEQARLEERLRRGQKMQAVGQLASGCAHHFNNLLTVINGYAQFLIGALGPDSPLVRDAEAILKAGERAASLTSQLLAFGCPAEVQTRLLDLNDVLRDVGEMLHSLLGEDVVLKMRLAEDLEMVKANPGQMEVVVLNLATNAREAMPSGGVLSLETANVELDGAYAARHPGVEPGHYVMMTLSDSGGGMTPEVRERIFEPFFTTKDAVTRAGMGLATVYGIIQQSGGHIQVSSEPGLGTTFEIYLPRVDDTRQIALPTISSSELPRGTETILVLEDQDQVREFASDMLERLGYNVLAASNGNDALALCLTMSTSIDLLLADVVMPNMSGPEFVERLRQLHQGFEVIYMSGYPTATIANYGPVGPEDVLIQKPFTLEELAYEVRRALNKRPA